MTTLIPMLSGARIDLLAPDWRGIELADVAHGLAAIRRWNGQARRHVSVAEHSRRVHDLVAPRWRLAAALHDAGHEPFFGDLIVPSYNAIVALAPAAAEAIEHIKITLDVALCRAVLASFGPAFWPDGQSDAIEALALAIEMRSPQVRRADRDAAAIEARGLGRAGVAAPLELGPALPDASEALAWLDLVKAACAERYGAPA